MPGVPTPCEAEQVAHRLLAVLDDRWRRTQRVAAKAADLAGAVADGDRELLIAAAWWHDLGYSPELYATGLHQLDGARYLTDAGYPEWLCALIAHHSAATYEAEERGWWVCWTSGRGRMARWQMRSGLRNMTTGPRGEQLDYPDRLAEILHRYAPDSVVARAMRRAQPAIAAAISRTRTQLGH